MAVLKTTLKKDFTDGEVLYGNDLNGITAPVETVLDNHADELELKLKNDNIIEGENISITRSGLNATINAIEGGEIATDHDIITNRDSADSHPISAITDLESILSNLSAESLLDRFYPVGTIYKTTSTNLDTTIKMANHFGGTWEAYGAGRVLVALDGTQTEFDVIGETGGAKTHTLTTAQMPSHTHSYVIVSGGGNAGAAGTTSNASTSGVTGSTGGGQAHNNLQPYIVVYRYRRTA